MNGGVGWELRVPEPEVTEPERLRITEQTEAMETTGVPEVMGQVPEVTEQTEMPEHRFP
jgi:hypothetical protein